MAFEVQGTLKEIYDEQQVTDRFKKREFVLEIMEGFYAEFVKFQLTQDKCGLADGLNVGEEVKVSFNLKGRPYSRDGKTTYFTNLEAWKIEKPAASAGAGQPAQQQTGGDTPPPPSEPPAEGSGGFEQASEDELPF